MGAKFEECKHDNITIGMNVDLGHSEFKLWVEKSRGG